jgi:hypothetical protein
MVLEEFPWLFDKKGEVGPCYSALYDAMDSEETNKHLRLLRHA